MSEPEKNAETMMACPGCGESVAVTPVTQVREGSPELEALMHGQLNRGKCDACEKEFLFDTPVLYRDDAARYVVYYLPRQMVETVEEAIAVTTNLYETVFAELDEPLRPECRLALMRNHFIEKIALHQQGLDDRLVEYVKYQLYQHSEGLKSEQFEILFDFGNIEEEQLNFLAFDRQTGQVGYQMAFQNEDYEDLESYFLADPESVAKLDELFMGSFVQVDCLLGG